MGNQSTGEVRPKSPSKVAKPGVYDLSMAEYHGDCCIGPSISSSGLRTIHLQTPAHYFAESYLNPNREEPDSPALKFGRAAHCLLLGDEVFENAFALRPFKGPLNRNEDGWTASQKRDWRDRSEAAGLSVLRHEQMDQIEAMRDELARDPFVQGGIFEGEVEKSIIWQDRETGIWLKARPDVIPTVAGAADDTVADYKTIDNAAAFKVDRAMLDRMYAMQLALCAEGLWETRRQAIRCFVLVFQEKSPPYSIVTQEIDPDWIFRAAQLNRRAIRQFAECVKSGEWPSYEHRQPLIVPKFLHDRLQAEEDAGLLPAAPEWCEQIKHQENAA